MEKNSKNNEIKQILIIAISLSIVVLIWNEIIINSSPSQATKKEDGFAVNTLQIDDKNHVSFREKRNLVFIINLKCIDDKNHVSFREKKDKKRFRAIAVSQGVRVLGWSITDDVFIECDGVNDIHNEVHQKLSFKRGKQFDVVLVTVCDPKREIEYPLVKDQNGKILELNNTINLDFMLYYAVSKEPIDSISVEYYDENNQRLFSSQK